jgi:hypothetical protein
MMRLREGGSAMGTYEIRVKGHLDQRWSDWFDGLTITHQASYPLEGELVAAKAA